MIYFGYTEAGDFGAIRLLSAPYLCRLYRLHCFLVVSVGLSVQVALRHWLLHAMELSHWHLHAIRACMPVGSCMRFSLACPTGGIAAFALACHCRASHCRIRSCIHQSSTGSMHACVCCCCVRACVFRRRVWPHSHVPCCLAPPT